MKNQNSEQKIDFKAMPIVNQSVAGIDIGSKFHVVAVGDNPETDVKEFGVSTIELFKIAEFLKQNGVKKVAMEATGGFESPLVTVLQESDFEVLVTGGANTKNYRRFKSDVSDAIHIRTLHALGLLPPIFITEDFSTKIRSLVRFRKTLIANSADYIRRIQKSLRAINVRLDAALADTFSVSGMKMLQAICQGKENPIELAELAHHSCKKSKSEIAELLNGNWNDTIRFEVRSAYRIFCNLQNEIKELDKQLDEFFKQNADNQTLQNPPKLKTGKNQNTPDFEVEKYALQIFGVNLNEIPGFGRDALLNFIAEVGDGIHRFHSAKAFAKWLGFTPNNKASGGKILSKRTLKNKSPLPNNFRMVANAIGNIKTSNPLTNFFNKIAFRSSRISAVTATARKVAVIVYNMLTKKEEFQSEKIEGNKQKIKLQQIKKIKKNLHKFDISLQDLGWNM
jgi:transposase